jgi:hypothetical protein
MLFGCFEELKSRKIIKCSSYEDSFSADHRYCNNKKAKVKRKIHLSRTFFKIILAAKNMKAIAMIFLKAALRSDTHKFVKSAFVRC